jgi:hypothetical protein
VSPMRLRVSICSNVGDPQPLKSPRHEMGNHGSPSDFQHIYGCVLLEKVPLPVVYNTPVCVFPQCV